MAWKAYLLEDIGVTVNNLFTVQVAYYDDADPNNSTVSSTVPPTVILHQKGWYLPPETTTAQLQAAVIAEGQSARAAYQKMLTAQAAVPKGTTVAIP